MPRGVCVSWVQRRRHWKQAEGTFPRPPRTFADQARVAANVNVQNTALLRSLNLSNAASVVQHIDTQTGLLSRPVLERELAHESEAALLSFPI